jgi:saccharopine dehydrogenase-like NADP-dependent oxidoreductase
MKVLVIGGYGAFGARIVRRLKRIHNLEVLTGGRNSFKADVVLDVKAGETLSRMLSEVKPHLVIHTAGPFNASEGYAVAKACLAASNTAHKCNYLDLADDTDYVMGFGILNDEARKKGCLLVTGASTTPAITTVRQGDLSVCHVETYGQVHHHHQHHQHHHHHYHHHQYHQLTPFFNCVLVCHIPLLSIFLRLLFPTSRSSQEEQLC